MPPESALPTWDLTPFFPSLDSPEFEAALAAAQSSVADLEALFDAHAVGAGPSLPATPELAQAVSEVIERANAFLTDTRLIGCFIYGYITTDSRNDLAQAQSSRFQKTTTASSKLWTRLTAWAGRLPLEELAAAAPTLKAHLYAFEKMKVEATKLMSPEEEALAADLRETGSAAWSKLYGNYTSQIQADWRGETVSISALRNMAFDPDPVVRKEALEAELAAWKRNEMVVAMAFNDIKGQGNLLAKRRGWTSLLEEAVFDCNIDQGTLDAMLGAARDAFPVFRRYLRAKAKLLGHPGGLPWYDVVAPVGESRDWEYGQAKEFVSARFHEYSQKLGDMADRAFRENWVDVGPRLGKRDGAFCMPVRKDESRVLMNFKPAFGSVSTLAHELGHAYHNVCLADRTPLQQHTPMTLAETASIFCETIAKRAALRDAKGAEALGILEGSLQGAFQVVVDITSRFVFEKEAIERRAERELSATELCDIMSRAQQDTYGDGLAEGSLHPYMWAVKPHYYGRSYYNFPYMFGLLFGLGLYAVYEAEPQGFHARYDDLLGSTGLADAATLGARFGIDIRAKSFWAGSLRVIEADVVRFEELARG